MSLVANVGPGLGKFFLNEMWLDSLVWYRYRVYYGVLLRLGFDWDTIRSLELGFVGIW